MSFRELSIKNTEYGQKSSDPATHKTNNGFLNKLFSEIANRCNNPKHAGLREVGNVKQLGYFIFFALFAFDGIISVVDLEF